MHGLVFNSWAQNRARVDGQRFFCLFCQRNQILNSDNIFLQFFHIRLSYLLNALCAYRIKPCLSRSPRFCTASNRIHKLLCFFCDSIHQFLFHNNTLFPMYTFIIHASFANVIF